MQLFVNFAGTAVEAGYDIWPYVHFFHTGQTLKQIA